jgi:MOSC domain-containing protein YiiM
MPTGTIVSICISPVPSDPMQRVPEVLAIAGAGLAGDRYAAGAGSFNKKRGLGARQVTLIHDLFVRGAGFNNIDTRRNIIVDGRIELMELIGKEFGIGEAVFRGVQYCDPCERLSKLCGKAGFREALQDRGGLVAAIITSGIIKIGSQVIPPLKG